MRARGRTYPYAELVTMSNFSFLEGASHPHELVEEAARRGHGGIGLADRMSVAGVVRAHVAAKEVGLRFAPGARLVFLDGPEIIAYPRDRAAWGRLTRLLSTAKQRGEKGEDPLWLEDMYGALAGMVLIALAPGGTPTATFETRLKAIKLKVDMAPGAHLYLAGNHQYRGDDVARIRALSVTARRAGVKLLATNDVIAAGRGRKALADVLFAIKHRTTVAAAGTALAPNGERILKPAHEMARLFTCAPTALATPMEILGLLNFSLDELKYNYPSEPVPPGNTPDEHLRTLVERGLKARFPDGTPEKVRAAVENEMGLVAELGYAPYFLTVHDIVSFARGQGILCQGRGSAANSVICYAIGITAVNPMEIDLLFERFISAERDEPPDIDVDFEHERREEVMQYIYARYGRHRAALAATVVTYRAKSAVRE